MVKSWLQVASIVWSSTLTSLGLRNPLKAIRSFIIFTLALFLLWLSGESQQVTQELTWLKYILMAGGIVFIPTVLFNFFRVPYDLYKETFVRANKAEEKLKPRIILATGSVDHSKKQYHVRVENLGGEPLKHCIGYLNRVFSKVEGHYHEDLEVPHRQLRWPDRYGAGANLAFDVVSEAELILATESPPSYSLHWSPKVYVYPDYAWVSVPCVFEVEVAATNSAPVLGYSYLSIDPFEFKKHDEFIVPPIYQRKEHRL